MGNLLQNGTKWLGEKLKAGASVEMIYRRGSSSLTVQVTRGRTEYPAHDDEGNLVTEVTDLTLIMAVERLVIGGKIVDPEAGDTLEERTPKGLWIFQVMNRRGLKAFRIDPSGKLLWIHTKLIQEP